MLVVDLTHTEPWVLATYTLHIRRMSQPTPPQSLILSLQSNNTSHSVCHLHQVSIKMYRSKRYAKIVLVDNKIDCIKRVARNKTTLIWDTVLIVKSITGPIGFRFCL